MDTNAKVDRVNAIRRKRVELIAELAHLDKRECALLRELLDEHGLGCGVDSDMIAAAAVPKDPPPNP